MSAILEIAIPEVAIEAEPAESAAPIPESRPLLLEIGCEEIPARFLVDAQKQFGERLRAALDEARLLLTADLGPDGRQPFATYSTPRRLVAHVPRVLTTQPDQTEEVTGPPVKVAFDAAGKPTRAAESFAQKNGVRVEDLLKISTPKGEYLQAKKLTPGRQASVVLREILPGVITGLAFPKSMYWEPSKTRFVRPIRWILALLGEGDQAEVVPFEVAGVRSGKVTYGHRALGIVPIQVNSFDDYAERLRQHRVEFDPSKRRWKVLDGIEVLLKLPGLSALKGSVNIIRAGTGKTDPEERLEAIRSRVKALPEESDLRLIADRDLEEWVVNSTECPYPIMGTFEERFLKLPREILITVMRDHQKYFAVESGSGELQPCFVTVLNVPGDPKGTIRSGHERVLTARFSDAEFFWNADQRVSLGERYEKGWLDKVTYQAKLERRGTYGQKIKRMKEIARYVWADLQPQGDVGLLETGPSLRAVDLCKCDLTTQMVQEFTELQGVVGGLYAREQGEPEIVWQAVYDHYKPANMEDQCPRSVAGAVVSIADKLDALLVGFSVGVAPTGSSDPFGLRRAGNGVIKVAAEKLPGLDVHVFLEHLPPFLPGLSDRAGVLDDMSNFLADRAEYYLREVAKLPYDVTRAVVHSTLGWGKPADARLRGDALRQLRDTPDFVALSQAAKRTRNILIKSADVDYEPGDIKPELFSEPAEHQLYQAFQSLRSGPLFEYEKHMKYLKGFLDLAKMRPSVDAFFDKVLVMTDEVEIRRNRLTLLNSLYVLVFGRWADLSLIGS